MAPASTRQIGLDVLRGVAILLVLAFHLPGQRDTWPVWLRPIGIGGWTGVDLFFALSGFLVGGLLIREYPHVSVGRFLARRALKIYPAFYVMLACLAAWMLLTGQELGARAWWSEVLFLQSYCPRVNPPSWSLAVEEHFYLLLAGVVFLLARQRAPVRVLLLVAVGIGAMTVYLRWQHVQNVPLPLWSYGTHLRLDSLLWGVALAVVASECGPDRLRELTCRWRAGLLAAAVLCYLPAFVWPMPSAALYVVGFSALSLGGCAWILLALRLEQPGPPAVRLLARVGRHSYSVYLWHGPIYLVAGRAWPPDDAPAFAWPLALALLVSSLLVGIAMSAAVEWPVLRWRDRYLPTGQSRSAEHLKRRESRGRWRRASGQARPLV